MKVMIEDRRPGICDSRRYMACCAMSSFRINTERGRQTNKIVLITPFILILYYALTVTYLAKYLDVQGEGLTRSFF